MVELRSLNDLLVNIRRTAFDWSIYSNRSRALRLLRRCKTLADTVLETEDGFTEVVHFQAISALCPKLIKSSKIILSNENSLKVRKYFRLPKDITGTLARKLVDCAYGELVSLSDYTFCQLYQIATKYKINHVIYICLNYAQNQLDVDNCIRLFILGLKHKHLPLTTSSYSFIRRHFKRILVLNEDFHLLTLEYLMKLLEDDLLRVDDQEELTWLAIVRWVEERQIPLNEMLDTYNRMVSFPYPIPTNNYVQRSFKSLTDMNRYVVGLMNFHMINVTNISFQTQPIPLSKLLEFLRKLNIKKDSSKNDNHKLIQLFQCLRFNRFRSIEAFQVIQSTQFVESSDQLTKLVEYMKLRYVLRKRLPFDKVQFNNALPKGTFAKIYRSERTLMQRIINKTKKTLILTPIEQRLEQPQLDLNHTETKPTLIKIIPLDQETICNLDREHLQKAKEPRIPSSVVLIIGGWQDKIVSNSLLAYDQVYDKWYKLNIRLPEPRAFHASCSYRNRIYIMGGTDGRHILNSVIKFNPSKDILLRAKCSQHRSTICDRCRKRGWHGISYRFHHLPPMRVRRCHFSAITHCDDRIYAIGGHDGIVRLRSGEYFTGGSDRWLPIADMTMARSDASACSHDNKIFVAGGQIGEHFIQASVEFYKPNDNTWTFAAPMIVPRMSFKLVAYRNQLMAIGGINGIMGENVNSTTRTVERYNPAEMSWNFCAPLVEKRSSFGVVSSEKELLVLGGIGGEKHLKSCEALKLGQLTSVDNNSRSIQSPVAPPRPSTNGWQQSNLELRDSPQTRNAMQWIPRSSLPSRRSGFSVSLIRPSSLAREFTYHGSKHKRTWKWNKKTCETVIKQHSNWDRFKLMKRRKLMKHLKIALVVVIFYLIL